MKEFTVNANDAGQRLDKFVCKVTHNLPLSLLHKYFRKKRIKVNGKRAAFADMLVENDVVSLYIGDEFFAQDKTIPRQVEKPDVVYEDENILVMYKPVGLPSHDMAGKDSLVARMLSYLYETGQYDPAAEQSFAPALCNRIDQNTIGMVIAAKNAAALREMNRQIKQRGVQKYYLCIVQGVLDPPEDTLIGYLVKDHVKNKVQISQNPDCGGKQIITQYRTIGEKRDTTLAEVLLVTGRSHQVRAHLASIGHPLLGDKKYGAKSGGGQCLAAYKLVFEFEDGMLQYLNKKTLQIDIPFAQSY